ncbi:hypothetical protein D9613_005592 [Agrocybe pediades]|uniref:Uncharacterized protein n=1 Tax=Agrocybe pediades TaxID=84607 RepID=A0A8H4VT69_9AGAR|nr:hypothetical protein D9613_005592 [Agrocybe pediades]
MLKVLRNWLSKTRIILWIRLPLCFLRFCPRPPLPLSFVIDAVGMLALPLNETREMSLKQTSAFRLHRATWTQTELFLTFPPPAIGSITLIPLNRDETAGRFRVWLSLPGTETPILAWDRKVEGGFPELKILKQRIRDHIQPGKSLGHSDKK